MTKETIIQNINRYYQQHGTYPNSKDFNNCPYLPSARHIQRLWGGILALKTELGLTDNDARRGTQRSQVVKVINTRNNKIEKNFNKELFSIIDRKLVHRPFAPFDDSKVNIDYVVFHPTEKVAIGFELFYPSYKESFYGCLGIKQKKKQILDRLTDHQTKFYYVVTNPKIKPEEIQEWLKTKKTPLVADGVIHISEVIPLLKSNNMV
jgi:hypothetical protein